MSLRPRSYLFLFYHFPCSSRGRLVGLFDSAWPHERPMVRETVWLSLSSEVDVPTVTLHDLVTDHPRLKVLCLGFWGRDFLRLLIPSFFSAPLAWSLNLSARLALKGYTRLRRRLAPPLTSIRWRRSGAFHANDRPIFLACPLAQVFEIQRPCPALPVSRRG